jgi:uncharacterized protein
MTSQAQAQTALPRVRGLVFLGFPLHPANRPSTDRADHLTAIGIPMLFVQGTRDALADMALLSPVIQALDATLLRCDNADHSFHVPARFGVSDAQVLDAALDRIVDWIRQICAEDGR